MDRHRFRGFRYWFGALSFVLLPLSMLVATSAGAAPDSVPHAWTGHFAYSVDTARFIDCASGQTFPVALEGDYTALERAYLDLRTDLGTPVLVRVEGWLERRVGIDQIARPTLVVDAFEGIWRDGSCSEPPPGEMVAEDVSADLADTYWRLLSIESVAVPGGDVQHEAHLLFTIGESSMVQGATGCNRVFGPIVQEDELSLRFESLAATKMACLQSPEQEYRFLLALEQVTHWRIVAKELQLLAGDGTELLRFAAVIDAERDVPPPE